jgi:hypothetical protein
VFIAPINLAAYLGRLFYNRCMLEFVFQLLAIYLFSAIPCFAGWIANGGKWEDIAIPVIGSIFLSGILTLFVYFFV